MPTCGEPLPSSARCLGSRRRNSHRGAPTALPSLKLVLPAIRPVPAELPRGRDYELPIQAEGSKSEKRSASKNF
jgi:hypothetical protein